MILRVLLGNVRVKLKEEAKEVSALFALSSGFALLTDPSL